MRSFSRLLGAAALAVALGATSPAFAGDTSIAETLFAKGIDAMKRSQFAEACEKFAGSNEADPSAGTQINLALCNEKQGKVATAWGWYLTAAGLAEQRGQKDRADLARAEAAKLEPKLHKLVIVVKYPADGMVVTRNGAPIPSAVLGTELPLDPGDYAIEVNAKGKKPWKQTVHIASGPGVDPLNVPALEDAPVQAPPPAGPVPGADYAKPAGGGSDGSTQRTLGFVLGGAGILALVTAGGVQIFNLAVTESQYKDVKKDVETNKCSEPANRTAACPELERSLETKDDARKSNQLAAIIVGAGGGALLVAGIVLLVTAPSSKSAKNDLPLVVPILARDTAGLGLQARF